MPRKPISFELDFMIKDIFPRFAVKQFDDVSFNIKPKNQGSDYDTTGMTGKIFVGVNNDMFMQTTGITVSNNNINILLDRNMLQKQGRAYAEVELTDSNGTITSSSFIFDIDAKIGEGGQIPGEYEGFVAKYERLISEFKAQVISTIDNCNTNINSTINNCNKTVDNKLNDVDSFIDNKILDIEKRFNTLTSSQQQEAEVIDARDGEVSLKARLDRDLYKDGISLSDRIEAIEGLKDSQNMKYETDKGYLVCKETKNGVIDDLKIEGKTLVNKFFESSWGVKDVIDSKKVLKFGGYVVPSNGSLHGNCLVLMKNPREGIYTIVGKFKKTTYWNKVKARFSDGTTVLLSDLNDNFELSVVTFNIKSDCTHLYIDTGDSGAFGYVEEKSLILLEGDHTQNPPSYFEGLMSVGQDVDKIEVLSRKEDGNLLDIKEVKGFFGSYPSYNEGIITGGYGIEIHPNNLFLTKGTYIFSFELDRKTDSVVDYYTIAFCGYNSENILGNIVINTLNNGICTKTITIDRDINVKYIKFDCRFQRTNTTVSNICLSKTSNHTYTPPQSDKKQILFYNENGELEPIQELHEWDSIEKHSDNKWYYHKRSGKVVLNGSEDWIYNVDISNDNVITFYITNFNAHTSSNVISDKFLKKSTWNSFTEGIWTDTSCLITIDKSKLTTTDLNGFKQWLQANNVTVVYQLAEEEVYELAPLHLDSYANETLILCNSGAISPKMEFSITSHINELVKAYGERINLLEEKVYKYMVTQNRMQLASTYSADSVTFKVDYFSLCGDEENYNEDLYNLILNNILVGKDNYNYDKMFTMILDYASWNQISWEQFDILVGLMDIQHNPPVEELPTEDIIEEDIIENEETPVE